MSTQTLSMTQPLYNYWLAHGVHETEVMRALRKETQKLEVSMMQISPEQGQFMHFLVKLINAKKILEIGTFTGYSALAMASALPQDGLLITLDQHPDWTKTAKTFWKEAGVDHKIELRLAPALQRLDQLISDANHLFDLIFIDADKINYMPYYDHSMKLLKAGGLMLIDNVFFGGGVADPDNNLPAVRAIRALNARLATEAGVEVCMLPIGDGLTLVQKN